MLGEAMGKASGIRELGLKIQQLFRLKSLSPEWPFSPLGRAAALQEHHVRKEAHARQHRAHGHQPANSSCQKVFTAMTLPPHFGYRS